jgi:hypothetical protein
LVPLKDQGLEGIGAVVVDDFEHHAEVVRSTNRCGAEQVAVGVGDHGAGAVDGEKDQVLKGVGPVVVVDQLENTV